MVHKKLCHVRLRPIIYDPFQILSVGKNERYRQSQSTLCPLRPWLLDIAEDQDVRVAAKRTTHAVYHRLRDFSMNVDRYMSMLVLVAMEVHTVVSKRIFEMYGCDAGINKELEVYYKLHARRKSNHSNAKQAPHLIIGSVRPTPRIYQANMRAASDALVPLSLSP